MGKENVRHVRFEVDFMLGEKVEKLEKVLKQKVTEAVG
jgi:hypothetical protein